MLALLIFFAAYTVVMWLLGYLAPKKIILQVYRESGVKLYWVGAVFAGLCFVLSALASSRFGSLVDALAPAEDEPITLLYRAALLIRDLANAEFLVFPGWLELVRLPSLIKNYGHD